MKRSFAFLLFAFIILLSCSKKNDIDTTTYTGTWELRRSYGNGIIYNFTDYAKGNGNTLTFGSNGRLIKRVKADDTLYSEEHAYRFAEGKRCGWDDATDTLLYYGNEEPQVIMIRNGILSLESTMCVEGGLASGGNSYVKLN